MKTLTLSLLVCDLTPALTRKRLCQGNDDCDNVPGCFSGTSIQTTLWLSLVETPATPSHPVLLFVVVAGGLALSLASVMGQAHCIYWIMGGIKRRIRLLDRRQRGGCFSVTRVFVCAWMGEWHAFVHDTALVPWQTLVGLDATQTLNQDLQTWTFSASLW